MHTTLQKYFGYTEFRPLQEEIINDVLNRKDTFVLMPTGGGKSLCFQLPSLLLTGVTVVVSPLISLMKDQVDSLQSNGIAAEYLNSTLSYRDAREIKTALLNDQIDILYVAPERLMTSGTLEMLKEANVSLFAIDEAHCISEWGHDFRPEYRKLRILKTKFPAVPIIALTATATPKVQHDIVSQLNLVDHGTYIASFNRANLSYQVRPKKKDAYTQLLRYLKKHQGDSGIIYCYSRKNVDSLSNKLKRDGFRALPYHAGLSDKARARNQESFIKEDVEIIVATIAFGMGIDKPNVRFVIHYDLPKNPESYYQETGRGGRDGLECDCILFFSRGDRYKIEYFINQKNTWEERNIALTQLREMVNYCDSTVCRRKVLLKYFGEDFKEPNCGGCDVCLEPKETFDGTGAANKLLSCVDELGQRFGMNYVVDVLVGSKARKIIGNHHNLLKSHGSGREYSKSQWQDIAREMIQLEILRVEGARYPLLKLTGKSSDVMAGMEMVQLRKPDVDVQITPGQAAGAKSDPELFKRLKKLRKTLADKENIPPYAIFADTSLRQMAASRPRTHAELLNITGVGEYKLEQYGDIFLTGIAGKDNVLRRPNGAGTTPKSPPLARTAASDALSATLLETLDLYRQNLSIDEIAELRSLSVSTIASHFEKLVLTGEIDSIDEWVAPDKHQVIQKTINDVGSKYLSRIKAKLGEDYSYGEIKLVRAAMTVADK